MDDIVKGSKKKSRVFLRFAEAKCFKKKKDEQTREETKKGLERLHFFIY